MTPKEMLEKRATLINNARALLDKATEEKREPTAEERQQFDAAMKEAGELKDKADKLAADEKRSADLETAEQDLETSRGRQTQLEQADKPGNTEPEKRIFELAKSVCGDNRSIELPTGEAAKKYDETFRRFLIGGERVLSAEESRALQKDSDTAGGYLSASEQFMAELIQAVDNATIMRSICRVLPPISTADSLGAPSLDNDPADPTWVAEIATGSADSTMTFGKRVLKPHPLAQSIRISKTLLRRSTIGAEAIVRDRLAYKMGIVQENAFMNGTGALQPLGIFTASDNGISTSRDVSTGNTATSIMFDNLKECQYTLKGQYRSKARWIFHRDAVKQISKLKDGEGRYIWQQSVVVGQPDRILNFPVHESEYAPSTFETTCYVGMLGDFSRYWIVDALTMTIQVILELYAATNQNGYFSRSETDGMPVLEEAFVRVKLG